MCPLVASKTEGQQDVISAALDSLKRGYRLPHVIVADDGSLAGRITLNEIVRGPLQSTSIGYFVDHPRQGMGLASEAVGSLVELAFQDLGLHRIEAGTLPNNAASQRVLAKNGFTQFGYAPQYLHIAGAWRDHTLFQRINPAAPAPTS